MTIPPRPPTALDQHEPFPGATIVFRAAKSRSWINTAQTKGTPAAFYRRGLTRPNPDYKGLSVDSSKESIIANIPGKFYGFIRLRVDGIRGLGLDVVRDGPTHGNICDGQIYLPYRDDNNLDNNTEVERLATLLSDLSVAEFQVIPERAKR